MEDLTHFDNPLTYLGIFEKRSSTSNIAPQSALCRIHRPSAWLRARNAWISYHSEPLRTRVVDDFLSLYSRLSSTCVSLKLGNGIPMQTTARALLSVKSNPSLTFPRQTANIKAPEGLLSPSHVSSVAESFESTPCAHLETQIAVVSLFSSIWILQIEKTFHTSHLLEWRRRKFSKFLRTRKILWIRIRCFWCATYVPINRCSAIW